MSSEKIGNKLRKLRVESGLPLRKVAGMIDIDVAILSKMERGERRLTKEIVQKLAKIYKHDAEELLVLYLSEKVLYEIGDEDLALKAMQVAEGRLEYKTHRTINRTDLMKKLKQALKQFKGIQKAWLYGSFSRKDDRPGSDIDIALKTDENFSYFDLAGVQHEAEKLVNRKVDLGFVDTLKPYILEHIKPDLKLFYER